MPTTDDDATDDAAADAETLMKCFVCYEVSASWLSHLVYYTRGSRCCGGEIQETDMESRPLCHMPM